MTTLFKVLDSVDSTNNFLIQNREYWNTNFFTVRAKRQTAGRGRHSRQWQSREGNLYFSFVFKPDTCLEPAIATIYTGYGLWRSLQKILEEKPEIKWPNDILYKGAKMAGILTEHFTWDNRTVLIIGIGVNVNHAPNESEIGRKAISLAQISDIEYSLDGLMLDILSEIRPLLENMRFPLAPDLINSWNAACSCVGKRIAVMSQKSKIEYRVKGLDSKGNLLVLDDEDRETSLAHGEISYTQTGE